MSPKMISVQRVLSDPCYSWPPSREVFSVELDKAEINEAAEWCSVNVYAFIESAIADRLAEVQAAMEEERVGSEQPN
jgi:hypothetical protein